MAELKTKQNDASVSAFLEAVADERRRQDSLTLLGLMQQVSGLEPKMWGDTIIGFGSRHYQYDSGREGDMPVAGFSPRKQALTLYFMDGFDVHREALAQLGKHSLGRGCLYIKRLSDVDLAVLEAMIARSFAKSG